MAASLVEFAVCQVCSLEFRRETEPVSLPGSCPPPQEVVGVIQVNSVIGWGAVSKVRPAGAVGTPAVERERKGKG